MSRSSSSQQSSIRNNQQQHLINESIQRSLASSNSFPNVSPANFHQLQQHLHHQLNPNHQVR
jgi:hypothetical protein